MYAIFLAHMDRTGTKISLYCPKTIFNLSVPLADLQDVCYLIIQQVCTHGI